MLPRAIVPIRALVFLVLEPIMIIQMPNAVTLLLALGGSLEVSIPITVSIFPDGKNRRSRIAEDLRYVPRDQRYLYS
jgi:hypothetical protein